MSKLKVIELFSGIGAQAKALRNINVDHEIVATADWDIYANISYAAVHHYDKLNILLEEWEKKFNLNINNVIEQDKRERERERERERDSKIHFQQKIFLEMEKQG